MSEAKAAGAGVTTAGQAGARSADGGPAAAAAGSVAGQRASDPRSNVPGDFLPAIDARAEFVKRELDPEDERIEVGVAVVGGGTAGLAAANRILQLLELDPALREQLGEVPVAVIEKAKACGAHSVSGAVMRPGPLQELYPALTRDGWRAQGFAFGEVRRESVYLLPSATCAIKIPTPPNLRNAGNEVISVAALGRFQQGWAEEHGAYVLTETAATQLIVRDGRVVGLRTGDKGRGKDGEPLANFEPGADIQAKVVVLADGNWGHLTGAAIDEFNLMEGREPRVWELGVKEIWKVERPLDRVIHTLGPWPLKADPRYRHFGGTWLYPMKDEATGEDLVSIGLVVDLGYADATTSAHDLLQLFKTHPLVRDVLAGSERVGWSAKALPAGGYWSMPKLSMPGALLVGDAGGMVDTVALKGVHHCLKAGRLAGEAVYAHLARGEALDRYESAIDRSSVGRELRAVRNARQPFQRGFVRGAAQAGMDILSGGRFPGGRRAWHRDDQQPTFVGDTASAYPQPDGHYTFDKLSSVYLSGNTTRDDAPDHIRVAKRVPRQIAETWRWMCPAGVYEIPADAPEQGYVDVIVNYTNCVQCGAITAKGGRLTPPEGGDGPLYTNA
jgi:electron-transferring-flavoprotein dehydrogenase